VPQQAVEVRAVTVGGPGHADVVGLVNDYRTHYGEPSDPAGTDRWLRDTASAARVHCYLATVYSGPHRSAAGVALAFPSAATGSLSELWSLRDLYVSADHRGQGVGRALVLRVRDDARAAGAPRLVLQTEVDNVAALALYRGLGFTDQHGYVPLSLTL
jgi:ribosomal protein S18 acetylase RimI-like enzyme